MLQSLRGDEPTSERRVALSTQQILQALAEQRNGGIANPQLACGLLLFGQELAGKQTHEALEECQSCHACRQDWVYKNP